MSNLMRAIIAASTFLTFQSVATAKAEPKIKMNKGKIGSLLQEKLNSDYKNGDRQIMVYLAKKASFKNAKLQKSRSLKLASVYNESRKIAKESQASLVK